MGLFGKLFGARPNERLEALMAALARSDTIELRTKYYQELLGTWLLIPIPSAEAQGLPANQVVTPAQDMKIQYIATQDPEGKRSMLAFTGDSALRAWRPEGCDTLQMGVPDLCQFAARNGVNSIIINRAGPSGGLVTRPEFEALAEKKLPPLAPAMELEPAPAEMNLRPPDPPDEMLVAVLRAEAGRTPGVMTVYLARYDHPQEGAQCLIGLEIAPGTDPNLLIPEFGDAVLRKVRQGQSLTFAPFLPTSALDKTFRKVGLTVFSRAE